jgi:hypothetical protein
MHMIEFSSDASSVAPMLPEIGPAQQEFSVHGTWRWTRRIDPRARAHVAPTDFNS